MRQGIKEKQIVAPGTLLKCIKEHPDGIFQVGEMYRVSAHRDLGKFIGVRIRDAKRERKDFNFLPTSKNYLWNYFKEVDAHEGEGS